jgi:hypothetical protein
MPPQITVMGLTGCGGKMPRPALVLWAESLLPFWIYISPRSSLKLIFASIQSFQFDSTFHLPT